MRVISLWEVIFCRYHAANTRLGVTAGTFREIHCSYVLELSCMYGRFVGPNKVVLPYGLLCTTIQRQI